MNIIVTMGDPHGVGIECMLKAMREFIKSHKDISKYNFEIVGNASIIQKHIDILKFPAEIKEETLILDGQKFPIVKCGEDFDLELGKNTKKAGAIAAAAIEYAVKETKSGKYDAMVTMPVSKKALYLSGWEFPGHTEMLAARCEVENPLMILCTRTIRVALLTVHIPISRVPEELDENRIIDYAEILNKSLIQDYGIDKPKIAVLGLNPHAGEDGSIGNEEELVYHDAIKKANNQGINLYGPFPSDGFFAHGEYKDFDGILASYHDQGLIPLKLLAKGAGVNYTAGLPIVRTSADHGTAFGIAGQNKAEAESSLEAIELAIEIVKNRAR